MNVFLGYPSQSVVDWIERKHCLWFEAIEPNATFSLTTNGVFNLNLEISQDNKITWTAYKGDQVMLSEIGNRVYIRATDVGNETICSANVKYNFVINGPDVACHGNIQCLLEKFGNKDNVPNYCYNALFKQCSSLVTAPDLPAVYLGGDCYSQMFWMCSGLTQTPELPSVNLADRCYQQMFIYCSNLTSAADLPATRLYGSCYNSMFVDCASLVHGPHIMADTLVPYCFNGMFNGCKKLSYIEVDYVDWVTNASLNWMAGAGSEAAEQTKIFKCPTTLPQTRGNNYIPEGWTIVTK